MRVIKVILWLAVGLGLTAALQWAGNGAAGLPVTIPDPWGQLLPYAVFLLFGVYLALLVGGAGSPVTGILCAVAGLIVAGLPVLYQLGLAEQYGLPADAGALGALLAGPLARGAAALWVPVAIASALRRPRPTLVRLPQRPAAPEPEPAPAPQPSEPFWSPAPALQPAERAAVAYTPEESGRA